jgi:cytochrome c-type biogenesis protein CcmH
VQIEEMALRAGVSYVMPEPGGGTRGPSSADIASAQDMTPEERMEMIGGMVESLGARLAEEGGTAGEWAQLITALGVLERRQDAMNVYQNALQVFEGSPGALDTVNRAAERAGLR